MGILDSVDLSGANNVKDKAVFIRFGNGVTKCEVVQTGAIRTFMGKKPLYTIDFKVLETTDPDLRAGDIVNFSQNPTTEWGIKTIRNFLVAAAGLLPGNADDQPSIDAENWETAIRKTSNNPHALKGSTVIATSLKAESKAGNAYSKVTFVTTPENRQTQQALRKAAAKKTA